MVGGEGRGEVGALTTVRRRESGENSQTVAPATVAPARAMRHTVAESELANRGDC